MIGGALSRSCLVVGMILGTVGVIFYSVVSEISEDFDSSFGMFGRLILKFIIFVIIFIIFIISLGFINQKL